LTSLQEQLTESRDGTQARRYPYERDDDIQGVAAQQQQDRVLRLENIIAECVSLLAPSCGVPLHLRRMLELDAPSVLRRDSVLHCINKASPTENSTDAMHGNPYGGELWLNPSTCSNTDQPFDFDQFLNLDMPPAFEQSKDENSSNMFNLR
jgi:hypothetical protein